MERIQNLSMKYYVLLINKSVNNLILWKVTDSDTIGLEETVMYAPSRFINAKCISK